MAPITSDRVHCGSSTKLPHSQWWLMQGSSTWLRLRSSVRWSAPRPPGHCLSVAYHCRSLTLYCISLIFHCLCTMVCTTSTASVQRARAEPDPNHPRGYPLNSDQLNSDLTPGAVHTKHTHRSGLRVLAWPVVTWLSWRCRSSGKSSARRSW